MLERDYRDIIGGALLALAGAWIAWYATSYLDLGTIRRMGPGLFPTGMGVLLSLFGIAIMVPAFFRTGTCDEFEFRSTAAVLGSVATFAMIIGPFGLLPAIAALVVVASLAETVFRPVAIFGLIACLSVMAYLIFSVGLGLPLAMVRF